jgi:hypothetical protein
MILFLLAPLNLVKHLAPGWAMLLMGFVVLVYFAGADLLHLARLGAYAALSLQQDEEVPPPSQPDVEPPSQESSPLAPPLPFEPA